MRFLTTASILLLSFGFFLSSQENPTESKLYERMGIITERGLHGAVPEENVDLFSGNLVLKYLDVTLPGPNGFDLNIWRVYNSKLLAEHWWQSTLIDPQQETSSWVGFGWSMHMGRIQNPDSTNPVIEFSDGRREMTYSWINDSGTKITRSFVQLKAGPTVHFQDGTVWTCGARAMLVLNGSDVPVALVTKIKNSYGHEINIDYYSDTTKMRQITDALGRVVSFNLDGAGNLSSITVPNGNGTATYHYSVVTPAWGDVDYTQLIQMKPPALNAVTYIYDIDANNEGKRELIHVSTSYGGDISYTFDDHVFRYFRFWHVLSRALVSKTLQFSSGNSSTWSYSYGDHDAYEISEYSLTSGELLYKGFGGFTDVNGPESVERAWFFGAQGSPDPGDPDNATLGWLPGQLAAKETLTKDGANIIASSNYVHEPLKISDEIVFVWGYTQGEARAVLTDSVYQTKLGTTSHCTVMEYTDDGLRKYGLPSAIGEIAPYAIVPPGASHGAAPAKAGSLKSICVMKVVAAQDKANAQNNGNPKSDGITFYWRYRKALQYAFTSNPEFADRNMLTLLSKETFFDHTGNQYKDTLWEYFANGAIKKISRWQAGGTTLDWLYTYAESGGYPTEITIAIDPPGAAGIETRVYRNGTLAKVAKPGFVEYDRTIYADGLIHTETNQHGGTMTFSYDDIGRITNIAMPSGFDPISAVWSTNNVAISRGGNALTKYWDGLGRNLGFEESGAGVTLYSRRTLDGEGRVKSESKGAVDSNHKTIYNLNENGQPVQVTDPSGKWIKYEYLDNTCTVTDMKGNQKVLTYSHLPGLVTKVVQAGTQTDLYYQGEEQLYFVESKATGESSRSQAYEHNGLGQLDQEYHPETGAINYQYDPQGNLASKTWGGVTYSYTYNAANQLQTESDGAETITFAYDANGRVQEMNSSTSQWRRYDLAYNQLGAVTAEKQSLAGCGVDKTVAYGYDANGVLDEITYPDGRQAAYGNNALLLPVSLSFNGQANRVSAVTYGVNKQPLGYSLANGALFAATYDQAGRIITSALNHGGNALLTATYGYDDAGNIQSLTGTTPGCDVGFAYDAFNRLTRATYPEKVYEYGYDPFGNMLSVKENSIAVLNRTYTSANRANDMNYDSRGNLMQGDGFTQVWDRRNRLVESRITATNALLGGYVYNERGLRVKAERNAQPMVQVVQPNGGESLYLGAPYTITWSSSGPAGTVKLELLVNGSVTGTIAENLPGAQTSYQWAVGQISSGWVNPGADFKVRVTSNAAPVTETIYYFYDNGGKLLSEYDTTGTCVKDYLYLGGKMIGEYQPAASAYYYYASDQINSTRLVTDSTGTVVRSAQYDPYGGLYKTWVDNYHPKPGFSGKERESGSEMDYFGARYYGHKQYRFNSVDPGNNKDKALANPQMWNLYSYCYNSPVSLLDPDGRAPTSPMDSWWLNANQYRKALGESTYNKVTVENAIIGAAGLAIVTGVVAWEWLAPTVAATDKVAEKYGSEVSSIVDRIGGKYDLASHAETIYGNLEIQLSKDGPQSIFNALETSIKTLEKHVAKLEGATYKSAIERTIVFARNQIKVIEQFMKDKEL